MSSVTTVLMGIVTLAMVATVLSTKSQTSQVVNSVSNGFANSLKAAEQG